jgi:hypothetical protein
MLLKIAWIERASSKVLFDIIKVAQYAAWHTVVAATRILSQSSGRVRAKRDAYTVLHIAPEKVIAYIQVRGKRWPP